MRDGGRFGRLSGKVACPRLIHCLSLTKTSQIKSHKHSGTILSSSAFNVLSCGVLGFDIECCVAIEYQLFERFWLAVENLQPISKRSLKMERTTWRSIDNWAGKWCQIVCAILFDLSTSQGVTSSGIMNSWQTYRSLQYSTTLKPYTCLPWLKGYGGTL